MMDFMKIFIDETNSKSGKVYPTRKIKFNRIDDVSPLIQQT